MNNLNQRIWYALATDSKLYCLGDCGNSIDRAEAAAKKMKVDSIWIIDDYFAKQWRKTLNKENQDV